MEFVRIPKLGDEMGTTIDGIPVVGTITAYAHNVSMTLVWKQGQLLPLSLFPKSQVFRWVGGIDQWITQQQYDAMAKVTPAGPPAPAA